MDAVLLTKAAPTVNLRKAHGYLDVLLEWNSRTDVDLGAMYELAEPSEANVVQALGGFYGTLSARPYISLDGDARSGGSEHLRVSLDHPDELKRVLIFAYIYEGGDWKRIGRATVTITHPIQGRYVVEMRPSKGRSVSLLDLRALPNGDYQMTREEVYFRGTHDEIDRHYGWPNLDWRPTYKD